MSKATIYHMDVREGLKQIPDHSVHCVITSPPYMALRNYGIADSIWGGDPDHAHEWGAVGAPHHKGQVPQTKWKGMTEVAEIQNAGTGSYCRCGAWKGVLGGEPSLLEYIAHLVELFAELKRVLHPSGTFWLNLGDSYQHNGPQPSTGLHRRNGVPLPETYKRKPLFKSKKQLGMVPARVALALQDDGWILRQDIIWAKGLSFCPSYSGSVMPESITDRAVWAHEHLFHFSVADRYYYDLEGCREPYAESTKAEVGRGIYTGQAQKEYAAAGAQNPSDVKRRVLASVEAGRGRNLRNVWVIAKEPLKEAHFASFPTKLVEPVVRLGSSEHGCCPKCYAPYVRNLVKEPVPDDVRAAFEAGRIATEHDLGRGDGYTHRKPNHRRKVLREGWVAGCDCGAGVQPCVVLDPFNGSGRAGVVATRLGRNYIGIERKQEYVDIACRLIGAEMEKGGGGEIDVIEGEEASNAATTILA